MGLTPFDRFKKPYQKLNLQILIKRLQHCYEYAIQNLVHGQYYGSSLISFIDALFNYLIWI
ncbi:TPA: hypothetical protein JBD08_11480 [Legionella pneumophila subsp. pneumophila]|nr:hypothetical protein [Legionella pneumophila]HAT9274224.1 hypothetical protein [Legionella pneumophila subsp. pneumophila]HAT6338643.1 hypothetical protein [Legionella pneumophila]HAT6373858.1 hypothetical protein [Legionella pneumophila]HAT6376936.1 hypothetical protein [Legionella pneumophila]